MPRNDTLDIKSNHGGPKLSQVLGTFVGLVVSFAITFAILTFAIVIPFDINDVIRASIVQDFINESELELKLAVVGTVLYPSSGLYNVTTIGAQGASVLMFLAWGTGGLIAGLIARDFVQGIFAAVFSTIIGAFLIWLLVFFIKTENFYDLIGPLSMTILNNILISTLYPAIAAVVGGLLGGGITRER
jgi:hypothetical protein